MSVARHHAEWLSLVETSGPFLSMPVLLRAFPQGLDAHDPEHAKDLRIAFREWESSGGDPAYHHAWVRYVLRETLGMPDEVLVEGQALPPGLEARIAEHGETLRPDLAVLDPDSSKPRLLVQVFPPGQDLDKPVEKLRWKASPATRTIELLHATDVKLGLVTNGERWMLVYAPRGETTGLASWYASLWLEEALTLRAFRSLLSVDRFFGVTDNDTIEALYEESSKDQQEVTDQLGYQVRRAVEVLVAAIDHADKDRGRALLAGTGEKQLYEAALTVMMRLVFLFSAEERELLLLGDPLYDEHYAVSTLRDQLREAADRHGEEVLERRHDAYSRLLATFRAVYGGVEHEAMRLPAYGGTLFDPDRFPFLEGRTPGTSWLTSPARPLPIHNRTVLHLLEALQVLQVKVPGGGPAEARRLSFRALDIEQIGHVYEGLLDHTALRAPETVLSLAGKKEPEVPLSTLEELRDSGEDGLLDFLNKETGRTRNALKNALATPNPHDEGRWRAAFDNDEELANRTRPFAGLVRDDMSGYPVVVLAGSVYVTKGSDRRESGTHYTPRSLTEPIVQHTLDPLVYEGPAEGWPKEDWRLRPAGEILSLTVCDMAMGSGAFLVQACRYLSERLVEAWEEAGEDRAPDLEGPLPADTGERLAFARRLVADRCLYGVDKNPLAVEMGKLSLWLITLQKDRPFTFLDHALRSGDSLLGVTSTDQITHWSLDPEGTRNVPWFALATERALDTALDLRRRLHSFSVLSVRDAEAKARLLREAEEAMELVRLGADLLVAAALRPAKRREAMSDLLLSEFHVQALAYEELREGAFTGEGEAEIRRGFAELRAKADELLGGRRPFHWPLEFPEVFVETKAPVESDLSLDAGDLMVELAESEKAFASGFAAIVGNPPFQGGRIIGGALGEDYRDYLATYRGDRVGSPDLSVYFLLRCFSLLKVSGCLGLISTNSIVDTGNRVVGLEQIVDLKGDIYSAVSQLCWPGTASVYVSSININKEVWRGERLLDGKLVSYISSRLDTLPDDASPYRLAAMRNRNSQGISIMGEGFVLSKEERDALISVEDQNREVIRGYFNGEDLNTLSCLQPRRWIIDFDDMDLEEAIKYKAPFNRVEKLVRPYRDGLTGQIHEKCFWKFWDRRPRLQLELKSHSYFLACAIVSKYIAFQSVPTSNVYNHKVKLLFFYHPWEFAVLQSSIHDQWARWRCGALGGSGINYSTSQALDTFPMPSQFGRDYEQLNDFGRVYQDLREKILRSNDLGMTETYNRFHNPEEPAEDIERLRELHVEMDRAVAGAYGWGDLDLGHGFHETKQGMRYTISEEARREVLDRLLLLNHERYAEEVEQGLHDKKTKKGKGKKRGGKKEDGGTTLTGFGDGA